MLPQEIIRRKREKQELSPEEISFFIKGITDGTIADCQIGSLTMAVFLNGMSKDEIRNLTISMRNSGEVLSWPDIDGPVVDKHSTGGVGDKISLMLAPMLAACGAYVPMISGRGLGHTGGTLDKLDSIPNYQTTPSNDLFRKTVKNAGCAIIGQTGNLAPADKKIYAIRDVSATVESIPLITASILSKKLAAGLNFLIMDLKCGNGAFMSDLKNAKALADSIVNVANAAGTKTSAIITDMNQVLGSSIGNALEVLEAVNYLKNTRADSRLHNITLSLASNLLVNAGIFSSVSEAEKKIQNNLNSGKALEIFARMITALGGPSDFVEKPEKYLPASPIKRPVFADKTGYITSMNTRNIGLSIIDLKGGRTTPEQKIDHSTGYTEFCQIGAFVDEKTPLAFVHALNQDDYEKAASELIKNITISEKKPNILPEIIEVVS
ncbi:MAG: thymidine phosphorylase [Alphaproteobacteria bacterium]|nr:thymidine phosphorylase [Alphaproteobacteria bacterium]